MPANTVVVSRPSKWGNPFKVERKGPLKDLREGMDAAEAKEAFAMMMETGGLAYCNAENVRRELKGKNLACWCKIGTPCHADVLLKIAND